MTSHDVLDKLEAGGGEKFKMASFDFLNKLEGEGEEKIKKIRVSSFSLSLKRWAAKN